MEGHGDAQGVTVIRLPRSLPVDPAPRLWHDLERTLGEGHARLALDMSDVTDLSDACLGAMIRAMNLARESGGDVRLFAAPPHMWKFLEAVGLDQVFYDCRDENEAVASFEA